jgi:hypothetical protein
LKRGADAPLKHPHIINPEHGELKRGGASLLIFFPLSFQGEGDKGDEVNKNLYLDPGQSPTHLKELFGPGQAIAFGIEANHWLSSGKSDE